MGQDYLGEDLLVRPHETHGTQVTGIMAARDNSVGMRRVAPQEISYYRNFLAEGASQENARTPGPEHRLLCGIPQQLGETLSVTSPLLPPTTRHCKPALPRDKAAKGVFFAFSAGNDASWWAYSGSVQL